jgi:hypothetical protein
VLRVDLTEEVSSSIPDDEGRSVLRNVVILKTIKKKKLSAGDG